MKVNDLLSIAVHQKKKNFVNIYLYFAAFVQTRTGFQLLGYQAYFDWIYLVVAVLFQYLIG